MQDHILITGGAGFIGSHLTRALVARGHTVSVLDNLSEQIHGADPETSYLYGTLPTLADFIRGDVTSRSVWKQAIVGKTVIVHLAAETGTGQSMYQIEDYCRVNVGGTAALLEELVTSPHTVRKIIIASSRAVYGEGKYLCAADGAVFPKNRDETTLKRGDYSVKCPVCLAPVEAIATDEDSALYPNSIYGVTKLTQEQMVSSVGSATGIPTAVLRFQNVYGPGQSLLNPYTGVLSIFTSAINAGETINIFEDGKPSRDFVYIDDVVDATVSAIEVETIGNQLLNVGSGTPIDLITVVKSLEELHGVQANAKITGDFRSGDIRHNFADLKRIRNLLDYQPKWDFRTGLEKFVKWSSTQESGTGYFDSLDEMRKKGILK